jgi:hypothetical protein
MIYNINKQENNYGRKFQIDFDLQSIFFLNSAYIDYTLLHDDRCFLFKKIPVYYVYYTRSGTKDTGM